MVSYRNCQTYCVEAKNCQLVVWTSILGSQHLSFGVPTKGKNKCIMESEENNTDSKSNLQLYQLNQFWEKMQSNTYIKLVHVFNRMNCVLCWELTF